jgi:hypothetical protein
MRPLEENMPARMLLARLREGPASTTTLQRSLPLVHVARQIWELRHWYGFRVKTTRLPNRIAVYELESATPVPLHAPVVQQGFGLAVDERGRPVFGQELRRARRR